MNNPNACRASFARCHCELDAGHDGPHECAPDPVCGGSWLRDDTDDPGMIRVYRWPGNRPGCDAYDLVPNRPPDPDTYTLEYATTPDQLVGWLADWSRRKEQQLLDQMRTPGS
jgi:hypothetical protein